MRSVGDRGAFKRTLLAVVLVVAGVAALASPVQGKLSNLIASDPPTAGQVVEPEPGPEAATSGARDVKLSSAQRQAAIKLVRAYPRLREFAGTAPPLISSVIPWTTEDGSGQLIGAEVDVELPAPRAVATTTWPSTAFVSERRYVRRSPRFSATRVRSLALTVDLRRRQVVSVAPDPAARVKLPPGAARKPQRLPSNED